MHRMSHKMHMAWASAAGSLVACGAMAERIVWERSTRAHAST